MQCILWVHSLPSILLLPMSFCMTYHVLCSMSPQQPWLELLSGCTWWRHQMETFTTLLALCVGNSLVTDEFPSQRPVTRSFDIFFDLRLNKGLSKQSRGWWFTMPSHSLWCHCNAMPNLEGKSLQIIRKSGTRRFQLQKQTSNFHSGKLMIWPLSHMSC